MSDDAPFTEYDSERESLMDSQPLATVTDISAVPFKAEDFLRNLLLLATTSGKVEMGQFTFIHSDRPAFTFIGGDRAACVDVQLNGRWGRLSWEWL